MFDNSYYSSVFEHAHLLQISPVSLVEASAGKGTNIKILLSIVKLLYPSL